MPGQVEEARIMSDQDIEQRIARDIARWQRGVQGKGEPLVVDEGWLQTPPACACRFRC
jgi:hypothetical protein